MSERPGVSIITVVLNGERFIERTLRSVASLRWPRIQHVIVDGGSTDSTPDLVRRYGSRVDPFLSGPDGGIYDAMNRGLEAAREDFVWFLNAGDEVHDGEVLDRVFGGAPWADVYYGDALLVSGDGTPAGIRRGGVPPSLDWRMFRLGMLVCHQAMIVRRTLAPPYDLRLRYVSDIDWMIRILRGEPSTVHVPGCLCRYLEGGFSSRNRLPSLLERYRVLQSHYGAWSTLSAHGAILTRWLKRALRTP